MKDGLQVAILGVALAAFAALPGCASHKELKAPCSASAGSMFSSSAFATDLTACGPMVRQNSVTLISRDASGRGDPSAANGGRAGGVTVL
ncbi:hypothetical protein [Rhizobium hainanense]|uniref:Lipoprotein n=1 Tax=Rhizobium hainanense TaxID=52131 RepID=A0A1C3WKP7_9HYPH|nr:hypothetical protein [Rhizobium hainanense]SCB40518.1 hypothetical protein GA0061100_12525 [Rhizobium hainanense]